MKRGVFKVKMPWLAKCLVVLFLGAQAGAQPVPADSANSVEWQRVRLENYITDQIEKNLLSLLSRQQFVILTSLKVKKDVSDSSSVAPSKEGASPDNSGPSKLGLDSNISEMIAKANLGDDKNVFKRITSIDVTIIFDKGAPKEKVDLALMLTDRFIENTIGKKSKAKSETAALVVEEGPVEKKLSPKDLLMEFKTSLGILAAAILLTIGMILVAVMAFAKIAKFEKMKLSAFESFIATQKDKAEGGGQAAPLEAQVAEAHSPSGDESGHQTEELSSAVAKYKQLLNENFPAASLLIKQWLKGKAPVALNAVSLIGAELGHEDWEKILPELDESAKKEFKKVSGQELSSKDRAGALKFLGAQILDSYLSPPPKIDRKQLELLFGLSESECATVLTKQPKLGAVLLNLISVNMAAKVIELLPDSVVDEVTSETAKLESSDTDKRAVELANQLGSLLTETKVQATPFIERSVDLIPRVSTTKEAALFKAIADSKNYPILVETAERYFPSALVPKLPADVLRSALTKMTASARTEFIASQDGEFRTILVGTMGEPGKKLRDMLDMELAEFEKSETKKAAAKSKGPRLLREFTAAIRGTLRSNETAKEQARVLLKPWYGELTGGAFEGAVSDVETPATAPLKAA